MNTVLIRTATPADADALNALLQTSFSELLALSYQTDTLSSALPYMIKANPTLLESGTYYVAEAPDGALIGCGGWTAAKPGSAEIVEGKAHIRHFAVDPKCARRGIGTSILARCIDDTRALGFEKLHCFSTLNAEAFYRASGFRTLGIIDVSMGPAITFPVALMQLQLAGADNVPGANE